MTLAGLLLLLWLPAPRATAEDDRLAWRGVWEWSMDKRSDAALEGIADSCRDLGFNVLMMYPPADRLEFMADQCRRRGLRLYLSTVFSGGDPNWRQVMASAESERAAKPVPETHQHGGEPLDPDELFEGPLPCWNRPEVREHFRGRVAASARLPVDGLAFDMVGYANYRCCYCPACEARLADYREQHPDLTEEAASATCAERALVGFVNDMARAVREARPGIGLTVHVYPHFRPRPYYGNRLDVDTVGQTVSWFFQPHWPLEKVRTLTTDLVATQREHCPRSRAAPFIGFYSDPPRDVRSADRVQAELRIVRESGAEAMQMAELGHIIRKPEVARAVAQALGGKPEAFE